MSLLGSSVSITRYLVKGEIEKPVLETVYRGLTRHTIKSIDDDYAEKTFGWTSLKDPYLPDFEGSSFVFGPYLIFSLRLDKKSIPAKRVLRFPEAGKKKKEKLLLSELIPSAPKFLQKACMTLFGRYECVR